jgi:hypothetical protein
LRSRGAAAGGGGDDESDRDGHHELPPPGADHGDDAGAEEDPDGDADHHRHRLPPAPAALGAEGDHSGDGREERPPVIGQLERELPGRAGGERHLSDAEEVPRRDALDAHPRIFSAVAEVVRGRQRAVDVGSLGQLVGERGERHELVDDDVPVAVGVLVAAPDEQQRLAAHDAAETVVDLWEDDEVDLRVLVLEEHEDDAVCGCGSLPRYDHPGHLHAAAARTVA